MPDRKNRMTIIVASLFAFMALVLGVFVSQHLPMHKSKDLGQFHGTLLERPREVNEFSLMGIDNKPFNNSSLQGHWTMVFFGFSSCGSVCPTTMAKLAKMYRLLDESKVKALPEVVMVTLDPERDTLKKLGNYVKSYDPRFYGARGDEESVERMTKEMGIAYAKIALEGDENPQDYNIEHTGTIMMFNPQGQLMAFFTTPHKASYLASDYQLVLN